MSDLKDKLIKLGADHRDLRPHIRPILAELDKGATAFDIQRALDKADNVAVSKALDKMLDFQTVIGHDNSVLIGDHVLWYDDQDPSAGGWLWNLIGSSSGAEWIDDARDLMKALRREEYL